MNRRDMLKFVGVGGAAVATLGPTGLAAATAVSLTRPPKPEPMPLKKPGDSLSAGYLNELVERVNLLTEAQ